MKEWIYGRNPVYECLRAGRRHFFKLQVAKGAQEKGRLAEIIGLGRRAGLNVDYVSRQQMEQVSEHNQGVALQVSAYPYVDLEQILAAAQSKGEPPFVLILDALQDPQNLGSLLRTAEAVGVHGVLLPLRQTATISPAVVNSSSGASEHLLVGQTNLAQAIETLKQADVWVVGLDGGKQAQPPDKLNLKGAIALVVGNEGEGMRRLVQSSCDLLMRLPMRGQIESLNAAAAGSVALYLVWGARAYTGAK